MSQGSSFQEPLLLPGPVAATELPPYYFLSILYNTLFYFLLDFHVSAPFHHSATAATKSLFLSINWRLVGNRTHAHCFVLRNRLTPPLGGRVRRKMRARGLDKKELKSERWQHG